MARTPRFVVECEGCRTRLETDEDHVAHEFREVHETETGHETAFKDLHKTEHRLPEELR